jgi:opacity protein-like surface antigen
MKRLLLCLVLVVLCGLASPAGAAGWYLRGTFGFEWSLAADFSDRDASAASPPAYFGTISGSDGRQIGSYGNFGRYPLLEAALGKQLTPWLRAEATLAWRPDLQYRGYANFAGVKGDQPVSGRADAISGLANLYFDMAGIPGIDLGRFHPYLGGGVGVAHNRLSEMTYLFPGNKIHKVTITPGGSKTDIAFMAAVGTGITLTERIMLDISWRYTDLGRVETDAGRMVLNNIPAGLDVAGTWAPLRTQGVFAGIRYLFN